MFCETGSSNTPIVYYEITKLTLGASNRKPGIGQVGHERSTSVSPGMGSSPSGVEVVPHGRKSVPSGMPSIGCIAPSVGGSLPSVGGSMPSVRDGMPCVGGSVPSGMQQMATDSNHLLLPPIHAGAAGYMTGSLDSVNTANSNPLLTTTSGAGMAAVTFSSVSAPQSPVTGGDPELGDLRGSLRLLSLTVSPRSPQPSAIDHMDILREADYGSPPPMKTPVMDDIVDHRSSTASRKRRLLKSNNQSSGPSIMVESFDSQLSPDSDVSDECQEEVDVKLEHSGFKSGNISESELERQKFSELQNTLTEMSIPAGESLSASLNVSPRPPPRPQKLPELAGRSSMTGRRKDKWSSSGSSMQSHTPTPPLSDNASPEQGQQQESKAKPVRLMPIQYSTDE